MQDQTHIVPGPGPATLAGRREALRLAGIVALAVVVPSWHRGSSARAKTARPQVGDVPAPGSYHVIRQPGRYGLGPELPGSRYALIAGLLVRIDARSGKILSILRPQREVLD